MAEKKTATIVFLVVILIRFLQHSQLPSGSSSWVGNHHIRYVLGIKAIQKGNLTGKGLMGAWLGMNRGGLDVIGPSKFNFGGIGRWMFKKMMKDKKVALLPELRQT